MCLLGQGFSLIEVHSGVLLWLQVLNAHGEVRVGLGTTRKKKSLLWATIPPTVLEQESKLGH